MAPRLTGLKVFRPDVEACLRIALAVLVLTVVLLPLVWGYRQHSEAQAWRDLACAYRLKEALRERPVPAVHLTGRAGPCARLAELGMSLEPPRRGPAFDPRVWPSASVRD